MPAELLQHRLTKCQAAFHLGQLYNVEGKPFTVRALTEWMSDRAMPHFKVGHRVMFDQAAIERWADRRFTRNPERN